MAGVSQSNWNTVYHLATELSKQNTAPWPERLHDWKHNNQAGIWGSGFAANSQESRSLELRIVQVFRLDGRNGAPACVALRSPAF